MCSITTQWLNVPKNGFSIEKFNSFGCPKWGFGVSKTSEKISENFEHQDMCWVLTNAVYDVNLFNTCFKVNSAFMKL